MGPVCRWVADRKHPCSCSLLVSESMADFRTHTGKREGIKCRTKISPNYHEETMRSLIIAIVFLTLSSESVAQPVPQWAKEAVWYQIFPERFRNGDSHNDPLASDAGVQNREWHISPWASDWYKLQPWEKKYSSNFYDVVFDRRYGGDIEGIISRLPYLRRLGINAIYLNPVFEANSLHKYNTANYIHIDHNFGPDPEGDLRTQAMENPEDPSTWHWTAADEVFLR